MGRVGSDGGASRTKFPGRRHQDGEAWVGGGRYERSGCTNPAEEMQVLREEQDVADGIQPLLLVGQGSLPRQY